MSKLRTTTNPWVTYSNCLSSLDNEAQPPTSWHLMGRASSLATRRSNSNHSSALAFLALSKASMQLKKHIALTDAEKILNSRISRGVHRFARDGSPYAFSDTDTFYGSSMHKFHRQIRNSVYTLAFTGNGAIMRRMGLRKVAIGIAAAIHWLRWLPQARRVHGSVSRVLVLASGRVQLIPMEIPTMATIVMGRHMGMRVTHMNQGMNTIGTLSPGRGYAASTYEPE